MFNARKNVNFRKFTHTDDPRIQLRLSPELKAALEDSAQNNKRSITDELNARLIATFKYEEELMTSDRLERLIFCKKLAYVGKKPN